MSGITKGSDRCKIGYKMIHSSRCFIFKSIRIIICSPFWIDLYVNLSPSLEIRRSLYVRNPAAEKQETDESSMGWLCFTSYGTSEAELNCEFRNCTQLLVMHRVNWIVGWVAPGKVHSLDRRLENTLKYITTVHFSYLGSNANPASRCK